MTQDIAFRTFTCAFFILEIKFWGELDVTNKQLLWRMVKYNSRINFIPGLTAYMDQVVVTTRSIFLEKWNRTMSSRRPANIRLGKDVVRLRPHKRSSRRLQDVLIKTNTNTLVTILPDFFKTSWKDVLKSPRRLDQDKYKHLGHNSSRVLQEFLERRL